MGNFAIEAQMIADMEVRATHQAYNVLPLFRALEEDEEGPGPSPGFGGPSPVEEALSEVKAAQEQLEAVYVAYAEPDADFDELAKKQGELEAIIQATDGHDIERKNGEHGPVHCH